MFCQCWLAVRPRLFKVPPTLAKDIMISVTLKVSSSEAGAALGKEGNKIREIREMTKTRISVGQKTDSSDRIINIQGVEEDVMLAKHLITMHIKIHNAKLNQQVFSSHIEDKPELRAAATVLAKSGDI